MGVSDIRRTTDLVNLRDDELVLTLQWFAYMAGEDVENSADTELAQRLVDTALARGIEIEMGLQAGIAYGGVQFPARRVPPDWSKVIVKASKLPSLEVPPFGELVEIRTYTEGDVPPFSLNGKPLAEGVLVGYRAPNAAEWQDTFEVEPYLGDPPDMVAQVWVLDQGWSTTKLPRGVEG